MFPLKNFKMFSLNGRSRSKVVSILINVRRFSSNETVCTVNNLTKAAGSVKLFEDVSFTLKRGMKIGLLGPNGSGKSTLMKILVGKDNLFDGNKWFNKDVRVGYLAQEPELDTNKTVAENIRDGLGYKVDLVTRYDQILVEMGEPNADFDALCTEQGELGARIDELQCWDVTKDVNAAMKALKCPSGDESVMKLSGGEKRRVALARLLLEEPEMLLLDEPTNHLDMSSIKWIEQYVERYQGAVITITHDRAFLDNIADSIMEINRGRIKMYKGNYSEWMGRKARQALSENIKDSHRAKLLSKELEWIRKNPRGGQTKNKARVARFESLQEEEEEVKSYSRHTGGEILIPGGTRLGNIVFQATDISKSFDGRKLFQDLSFTVHPGDIFGIVGPNGAGKSTLFRILSEQLTPDSGDVKVGSTVEIGYVEQNRDDLDDNLTTYDAISEGSSMVQISEGNEISSRLYTAQFNIKGQMQEKAVGLLSGGERNRVHIARALRRGCNVLMLDEPTNDLDVETLLSLETALHGFVGATLIVSHDRSFVERICNKIIAFDGNGNAAFFDGDLRSYEQSQNF